MRPLFVSGSAKVRAAIEVALEALINQSKEPDAGPHVRFCHGELRWFGPF